MLFARVVYESMLNVDEKKKYFSFARLFVMWHSFPFARFFLSLVVSRGSGYLPWSTELKNKIRWMTVKAAAHILCFYYFHSALCKYRIRFFVSIQINIHADFCFRVHCLCAFFYYSHSFLLFHIFLHFYGCITIYGFLFFVPVMIPFVWSSWMQRGFDANCMQRCGWRLNNSRL